MLFVWKKVWVWVSLEEQRWVKKLPIQYWFPWTDNTFFDRASLEQDSWAIDTLLDATHSMVTKKWSEWTIWWLVYPNGIGFFLKALMWWVESNGEGVFEHRFNLLESNTHPSLTVWVHSPLWSRSYALAMIESMDFNAEVWGKFTVSVNLKARKWENEDDFSVNYDSENWFVANMLRVFIADSIEKLDIAENICLQSFTLSFKKEIKDIECISSLDPIDYLVSGFSIEWSMEVLFENNSYRDDYLNWNAKALRILLEDKSHPYWEDDYPTFMLDLSKVIITDWTPAFSLNDITKQSISFKWHYDIKQWKAVEVYLKNTQERY